jgi:endonuclease IV
MKQTALKRDEEQVQAIINHLNETMTDSFDIEAHPPCLMNICTQNPATKELGKVHFRTAALDLIYKISSLYHLHGTWTPG